MRVIGLLFICCIIALAPWLWELWSESRSKEEYATLQAIAPEGLSSDQHVIYLSKNGYTAIGILATSKKERIWMLLDPKYYPRLKILENGNPRQYQLSKPELKLIVDSNKVVPEVVEELSKHVQ